jgi:hypothetical protein
LKATLPGDDLYASRNTCKAVLDSGLSFLFTCGDESHPWIAEQLKRDCAEELNAREWTKTVLPSSGYWYFVAFGNGRFVTIPTSWTTSNKCAYSNDGITWKAATLPASAQWSGLGYGKGKFIATTSLTLPNIKLLLCG